MYVDVVLWVGPLWCLEVVFWKTDGTERSYNRELPVVTVLSPSLEGKRRGTGYACPLPPSASLNPTAFLLPSPFWH